MNKLEIFTGDDGDTYVRLRSRNGRIMVQFEGYTKRGHARRAAKRLKSLDWSKVKIVEL